MDLREIKGWHLEQAIPRLPGSNKTKKNILTVWAKMFTDAVRMDMIPKQPATPRLEIQEAEIKWLTKEQQSMVLENIPKRDHPIIIFLMTYGVRVGEARAIHWEDIDFNKNIITLKRSFSGYSLRTQTKTGNVRYLPLVDPLYSLLKQSRGVGGFVFRNFYGRPYSAEISRIWRAAVAKAGLSPITLYQGTRHSWASQRVNSGVNMELIRDVLGHTSIQTTQRYAKVSMDSKRRVIE
jgi:integrase